MRSVAAQGAGGSGRMLAQDALNSQAANVMLHRYAKLHPATLKKRYKRFLADVQLPQTAGQDAGDLVAYCPNTGPMTGLLDALPSPVLLSASDDPKRKYKYTLEWVLAHPGGEWVGVHSASANRLAAALLRARLLPQLGEYVSIAAEQKYGPGGRSRVDFLLTRPNGGRLWLEVKSVTLAEDEACAAQVAEDEACAAQVAGNAACAAQPSEGEACATREDGACAAQVDGSTHGAGVGRGHTGRRMALFPDTVSTRAQQHAADLAAQVAAGDEAALLFVCQRGDCGAFAPCHAKDAEYGRLVMAAAAAGVQVLAVSCALVDVAGSGHEVRYQGQLPVELSYGLAQATAAGGGGGAAAPRKRGRQRKAVKEGGDAEAVRSTAGRKRRQ